MNVKSLIFVLLVVFLPTQLALHFWPDWSLVYGIRVDYLAPAIYFTDILIGLLILLSVDHLKALIINVARKHKIKFLALVIFVTANITFAVVPAVALNKWLKLSELVLLGLAISDTPNAKGIFSKWIVVPLLYTALLAIGQLVLARSMGGVLYWLGERTFSISTPGIALFTLASNTFIRPYATFPHPNVLAGFSLISLLFLLAAKRSTINVAGIATASILVLLSYSQGAWIALLAIATLYLVGKTTTKLDNLIIIGGLLLSLFMPIVSLSNINNLPNLPQDISSRASLAIVSGHLIAKSPFVGVGLGNFSPATLDVLRLEPSLFSNARFAFLQPVHNIFLLLTAETGFIGLGLFVSLFVLALKRSYNNFIPLIFFVIFFTGLVDHYWLTLQQTQLLLVICFAFGFSVKSAK